MVGNGQRLSVLDALFLHLESPQAHMHVGWSALGRLPPDIERPTLQAFRARAESRLAWVPRCRQHLLFAPGGICEPRWVDDPHFDLDAHVVALSDDDEPLSLRRFAELRDELLSTPLDHSRPLWQIALFPRLADGRMGMVGRVHHTMADGASALKVAALVLDVDESDGPVAPKRWSAAAAPSSAERTIDPFVHGAELTIGAVGDAVRAALRPQSSARRALSDAQRLSRALSRDLLTRAPDCALNAELGPRRTLVGYSVGLDELRPAAGRGAGALNDVMLAVVTGALRRLALEREEPVEALKAMIPIDLRSADERGTLGNHVSMVGIWLPLQLPTAAARLELLQIQTARFKDDGRAAGTRNVLSGLGLLPAPLRGAMLRALSPRAFNLTISSMPGPRTVLSAFGVALEQIYPVIPIAAQQALSIGMFTYNRCVHFGMYADPDALPHVTRLPALMADEIRALRSLAAHDPQPARAPTARRPSHPPTRAQDVARAHKGSRP
ncbi:MAG: wax ester/triacylglycerol synthase family O-acyltransferase [Solirubrobacterales bacterium]|nr:wax ester/triacylglycerol synthase family O-acyltransferase [Solirubrobacterales bacterium]